MHVDADVVTRWVADVDVPVGRMVKKMSRGQRSARGAIVGIASRAGLGGEDKATAASSGHEVSAVSAQRPIVRRTGASTPAEVAS